MFSGIIDKQRAGCYNFRNSDYIMKQAFWLGSALDYDQLKESSDIYKPPVDDPNKEPDGYVMKISGNQAGVKGQRGVPITITSVSITLMENYRALKEIMFGKLGKLQFLMLTTITTLKL